ncbi:hypothetical protein SAMN05216480_11924 [Pustulibacterium marinum]|uniref:Uncharacterized protein n=1 Tax=Pustulibacterium marinum TaxID=1224947 RepID=A0A1I7IQ34_9FLAO|nr:hypothetical protein [Pustulibacterium marinum]SFU75030.1 hypothetical protein SAMN05216480_11924 [Pustulibacterium marinum]
MQKKYHKGNFFKHTYCVFKQVIKEDFPFQNEKPHYKSKSGSSYFYTEEGVFRVANHWGRAANCRWRIASIPTAKKDRVKIGFARWTDFYSDSETEKLYVITINGNDIEFQHKDAFPSENKIKRTAADTAKTIRKIKKLQEGKNPTISEEQAQTEIRKLIYT